MAFRRHKLGVQVIDEPARAALRIKIALRAEKGSMAATARRLGVDQATLWRWLEKLGDRGREIRALAEELKSPRETSASTVA